MGFQGLEVRESGDRIIFDCFLQDSNGNPISTGFATLRLYKLKSDGSLKSFEWATFVFTEQLLTTHWIDMEHQFGNAGTAVTGLWTYVLENLQAFEIGDIIYGQVYHPSSSPIYFTYKFQYGGGIFEVKAHTDLIVPWGFNILPIYDCSLNTLNLIQSNDYTTASGSPILIEDNKNWPRLTDFDKITFSIRDQSGVNVVVFKECTPGGVYPDEQTIQIDLTKAEISVLVPGVKSHKAEILGIYPGIDGEQRSLVRMLVNVFESIGIRELPP